MFEFFQKEQANVRVSYISDDPSLILKSWQTPKAKSNKYKDWQRDNHLSEIRKKANDDKWEFPRHRLKVNNKKNSLVNFFKFIKVSVY